MPSQRPVLPRMVEASQVPPSVDGMRSAFSLPAIFSAERPSAVSRKMRRTTAASSASISRLRPFPMSRLRYPQALVCRRPRATAPVCTDGFGPRSIPRTAAYGAAARASSATRPLASGRSRRGLRRCRRWRSGWSASCLSFLFECPERSKEGSDRRQQRGTREARIPHNVLLER